MIKTLITTLIATTTLVACSQDPVEKCVSAIMNANAPYKDSQEKAGTEANARIHCLNAAAGGLNK